MPSPFHNQTLAFRCRGFHDVENQKEIIVLGDGPEPLDSQGVVLQKLWDQDIVEQKTVSDHV